MVGWTCPHCGKAFSGLDAERVEADGRRHMRVKHIEEATDVRAE